MYTKALLSVGVLFFLSYSAVSVALDSSSYSFSVYNLSGAQISLEKTSDQHCIHKGSVSITTTGGTTTASFRKDESGGSCHGSSGLTLVLKKFIDNYEMGSCTISVSSDWDNNVAYNATDCQTYFCLGQKTDSADGHNIGLTLNPISAECSSQ